MAALLFDADHFKRINDTCGHKVGDQVLVDLARLARGCTRESDWVTRWGGEEFTVLMTKNGACPSGTTGPSLNY